MENSSSYELAEKYMENFLDIPGMKMGGTLYMFVMLWLIIITV